MYHHSLDLRGSFATQNSLQVFRSATNVTVMVLGYSETVAPGELTSTSKATSCIVQVAAGE
jgi:hypothetical protein